MKTLIDIGVGVIYGILFMVALRLLGIELGALQQALFTGGTIFVATVLNGLAGKLKEKVDAKDAKR
ncbi:MAG: hypothetical protein FWG38_05780 [Defluviitaleaceae bacterium]|nr:hypothetical protein [Defluviitaleaceae bacterium]